MSPPDRSRRRWENIIKADLLKGLHLTVNYVMYCHN